MSALYWAGLNTGPGRRLGRAEHGAMESLLSTLVVVALIAVLAVLGTGIVGMLRGGEFNRKYGNKLMRARVAVQALAIALVVVLYLLNRG